MQPRKIEEGDWVLVYDSNLDNQHKASQKLAKRWFDPYVVMSTNDNATYHIAELGGTRITVPVVGKRIKAFKKRHEDEPGLGYMHEGDDPERADEDGEGGWMDGFPSRSPPFLAHSGGCAGLVGVNVVGKTGYGRKKDRRHMNHPLRGGTQIITTCKESRTKDEVKQVYIK